ncbi:MAG: hypothetical protein QXV81_07585 [Ignisphaera sp.]
MHRCQSYRMDVFTEYEEEYTWGIALYIEVSIDHSVNSVTVCQHPTLTVVQDLKQFVRSISGIRGDEFTVAEDIAEMLDSVFSDWRKDFEVVLRRGSVLIIVYL